MGGLRESLLEFLERFQGEPRLRQRVGALTGASAFFAGCLIVAGLGQVVLWALVLAGVGGVLALTPWSSPRGLTTLLTGAMTIARDKVRGAQAVAGAIPPPTAEELHGWPYAGSDERVDEERRRASELNAHGTDLRRAGRPAEAAELHLEALEILQSLDDGQAQAPTLNSLALALAASGETEAAVERFEQSLSILRERPGDPRQGEVAANLGFALLRQGDEQHARELLGEALEKLPPESQAAHKVEAALRRAS